MPVPTDIDDISTDEAQNYPKGNDNPGGLLDNYLRAFQSIFKKAVVDLWKGDYNGNITAVTGMMRWMLSKPGTAWNGRLFRWNGTADEEVTELPGINAATASDAQTGSALETSLNGMVLKAGDSMTGILTLSGNATSALHAVPKQQLDSGLNGRVPTSRVITAGNGLTGGGNLTSNRTIHLGTPNTLSRTSTNNTNSDRHQHAITTTQTGAANTIVATDGSGDIRARLFRSSYPEQGSAPASSADIAFRNNTSDNYIRFMTRTAARSYLGVGGTSVTYLSGTVEFGYIRLDIDNDTTIDLSSNYVMTGLRRAEVYVPHDWRTYLYLRGRTLRVS